MIPSLDAGITPAFYLETGIPAYARAPFFDPSINTGFTTTVPQGGNIGYVDPYLGVRAPYYQNWQIGMQRAVTASTSLSVSYSASVGHFLPTPIGRGIWSNQIDPKYLALGNLLRAPATAANIATGRARFPEIALPFANFSGVIGQMLRPFPQYNGVNDLDPNFGNSAYHSIQVAFERRFSSGLQFLVSYTGSKTIDNAGSTITGIGGATSRTAYNNRLERSNSIQDIPKQLVMSFVYELPFGRGRAFSVGNRVLGAMVSGWQISGILSYVQGRPLGPIRGTCDAPFTAGCYADYNPSFRGDTPRINGAYGSGDLRGPTPTKFLDVNAFSNSAPYTLGSTPRTLPFGLRESPVLNENFALRREFGITERLRLLMQASTFNGLTGFSLEFRV